MSTTKEIYNWFIARLLNIADFSRNRVAYFGAQYKLYGVFAIANFLIPYFMWSESNRIIIMDQDISILLRFIAGMLAFGLITYDMWPSKMTKYLPIYWHITLLYSLPFLTTFLFLYNGASNEWFINIALSLFLLSVLVDWQSFIILLFIGILSGYNLYIKLLGHHTLNMIIGDIQRWYLFLYMAFFSILIGMLFSRNKEYIQRTVVRMLEKEVHQRTQDLEKALAIKTEFINNLSHEVRAPVHGITAISKGLSEDWDKYDDEKKHELAKIISNNANRLLSLISTILDLSKFNKGKIDIVYNDVDLVERINNIISECEQLYLVNKKRNISINFQHSMEHAYIKGDAVRLLQVLRNLFFNAISFGGSIIDAKLYYNPKTEEYKFVIIDNGVGIPKDEVEDIFMAFYQSSRTKTGAGGTGLGLSISREIIAAHGGKIYAENNLNGQGAKFTVILPKNMDKKN